MKIRYIDLFIVNSFLNKYSSSATSQSNSLSCLKYYILLNVKSSLFSLNFKKNQVAAVFNSYYFFKFSIYFILLNFLAGTRNNRLRNIFFYLYSYSSYLYLVNFLSVYYSFITLKENVLCVTKHSIWYLENSYKMDNFKEVGFINYLLRNKVRLVIDLNNSLSSIFLHRIAEFDVCVVRLGCKSDNVQWLFLCFIYYLKELSRYRFFIDNL